MHLGLKTLAAFLDAHQAESHLVLATVVATEGSTYRKPGAMMLVNASGDFAGLISGGCLEGDLVARTRTVLDTGEVARVSYDLKDEEGLVLGLGLGCGGAVHLQLQRLDREDGFEPLGSLLACVAHGVACRLMLVTDSDDPQLSVGDAALSGGDGTTLGPPSLLGHLAEASVRSSTGRASLRRVAHEGGSAEVLEVDVQPTPRVLVCGAGPDAVPLVRQVAALGWNCTVTDHRPGFADPDRFPDGVDVACERPARLAGAVDLAQVDAAVVMSHHVEHDAAYLAALAQRPPAYLGLLGPRARRDQLLESLGSDAPFVHGPAGLDLGAELPESIALAIMAEIHAALNGRDGGFLSAREGDGNT